MLAKYHPRNRIGKFYDRIHLADLPDDLQADLRGKTELIDEMVYRPIYKLRDAMDAMENAGRPTNNWRLLACLVVAMFVLLAVTCGCEIKPVGTNKTDNTDAKVERLFTDQNGYTVYRFHDLDGFHYYVVPSSGMLLEDKQKPKPEQQTN